MERDTEMTGAEDVTMEAKEDEDDGEDDLFGDDLDAEMEALTEAAMAAIPKSRF